MGALGDQDAATSELETARRTFQRLGATIDARAVARLTGESAVPGGLTQREAEVVAFVASGKPDDVPVALDAQRGAARTLADVPAAVDLVTTLDELDVIHGEARVLSAYRSAYRSATAFADGLAFDPDGRAWHLVVLYRPREQDNRDALTAKLTELARDYAEEHGAEVVEVASRRGDAIAIIRLEDPGDWAYTTHGFSPSAWDEIQLG